MNRKSSTDRSVNQRVGNAAREHKLIRIDAFVAYVMDRLLARALLAGGRVLPEGRRAGREPGG
jgi:hypothetical protein